MPSGPSSRSGRTKTTTDEPGHIERGSGNVFADLGIPNPDLALAKAELVRRIRDVIAERKLTQAKAAGGSGSTSRRCLRSSVAGLQATPSTASSGS